MIRKDIRLKTGLLILALVTFFFISGCLKPGSPGLRGSYPPAYLPSSTPGEVHYPDAAAVIILDEGIQNIYSQNRRKLSTLDRHTVIKILNERGYSYANISIPYEAGTEITNIRARTILPNGETVDLMPDQIFDTNYNGEYIYYSDHRLKRFTMPAIENGCIVEYSWQKRCNDFLLWPQWPFQRNDPMLISRYSVITPRNWELNFKYSGALDEPAFTRKPMGDRMELTWEAVNQPAFIPEISSQPGALSTPHLLFSPLGITSWQDVADWYLDLAEERMQPEKTIAAAVDRIIHRNAAQRDQLETLFSFVQQTIRYISIEIGMGGYQPHRPETVLRNRFGDCKDMVSLLIAMAKNAGITVEPVLISNWSHGTADTSLVTPGYFNHVIAVSYLEDGTAVWMDPTEKKVPFGTLPWYDQGRNVLVARRGDRAEIVTTPVSGSIANRAVRHWNITLDETGRARGTIIVEFEGAQAMEMRHQLNLIHPGNRPSWLIRNIFSHYPVTIESDVNVAQEKDITQTLVVSAAFSSDHLVLKSDDLFTLFPDALSTFDWHKIFPGVKRRDDIVMKHPLSLVDRIHITHPKTWSLISDKISDAIQTDFGEFDWDLTIHSPGTAVFNRTFSLESTMIPVERYLDFRNFLFKTALSDQTLILFSAN